MTAHALYFGLALSFHDFDGFSCFSMIFDDIDVDEILGIGSRNTDTILF